MSPYSTMARLRGIGVALISSICGWWLVEDSESLPADQALQRQALHHAEAMLLVDDAQTHARRAHLFLNQRVGADDETALRRARCAAAIPCALLPVSPP